ncbi:MAG: FlgD immunoglobulin-like domain containing protein [candidate division WOR-3 bacterium]
MVKKYLVILVGVVMIVLFFTSPVWSQIIYTIQSPGSEAWKNPSDSRAPPLLNPGDPGYQPATPEEKNAIAFFDTLWWITYNPDTTKYVTQLYRFRINEPINKIARMTFRWRGHRSGGYHPTAQLFVYDTRGGTTPWFYSPGTSSPTDTLLSWICNSADTIDWIIDDSSCTFLAAEAYKGSCPLLFSWNGKEYEFVGDVIASANLGLWVDRIAGFNIYMPIDPDEYLKIPSHQIKTKDNGIISIKLNEMKPEVSYIDQVKLLAVDHPEGVAIYPNEAVVFPPPPFKIFATCERRLPIAARTVDGKDVLNYIKETDRNYVPFSFNGPLIIEFDLGELMNPAKAVLFLNGSTRFSDDDVYDYVSLRYRLKQRGRTIKFPEVEVIGKDGRWKKIGYCGYPAGTSKTMVFPLYDKKGRSIFLTDDHRLRITFDEVVYVDKVWIEENTHTDYAIFEVPLKYADLHYYGYGAYYSEDGRYPGKYHYHQLVDNDFPAVFGNATKYGDVQPLLKGVDDCFVIMHHGDEIDLGFDASSLPSLKPGWTRDYIIYVYGYYKEALPGRAYAYSIEPLPFKGMAGVLVGNGMCWYPYDKIPGLIGAIIARIVAKSKWDFPLSFKEIWDIVLAFIKGDVKRHYPDDSIHVAYLKEWNKRKINEYYPEWYTDLPHKNLEKVPLLPADSQWIAHVLAHRQSKSACHHSLYSNYVELQVDTIGYFVEEKNTENKKNIQISLGPNPFRDRIQINISLQFKTDIECEIRNALGQSVRRLFSGPLREKNTTLNWDGLDQDGNLLPSGIYFFVLKGSKIGEIKKKIIKIE